MKASLQLRQPLLVFPLLPSETPRVVRIPVLPSNSPESTWKFTSQIPPFSPSPPWVPLWQSCSRSLCGSAPAKPLLLLFAAIVAVRPFCALLSLKPPGKGQPGMGSQLPRIGICEAGGSLDIPIASMVRVIRGAGSRLPSRGPIQTRCWPSRGNAPNLKPQQILLQSCIQPCAQIRAPKCFHVFIVSLSLLSSSMWRRTHMAVHT